MSFVPAFAGTSGSASSTSLPGARTQIRRPAVRGAARDSGPACGAPTALPRGSTTSQVAGCAALRGSLSRSQSAIGVARHARSVRSEAALNGAHVTGLLLVEKTVQVEFGTSNSDVAGEPEVAGGLFELRLHLRVGGLVLEGVGVVGILLREAAPGHRSVLRQRIGIQAEGALAAAHEGIEHRPGSGAHIQDDLGGQGRDVGGELQVAV